MNTKKLCRIMFVVAFGVLISSFCAYGQDFDEAKHGKRMAERIAKFRGVDDDSPGGRPFVREGRRGWEGERRHRPGQEPARRRIQKKEGCERCRKDQAREKFRERAEKVRRYIKLKKKHPKLAEAIKKRAVRKKIKDRLGSKDPRELRERRADPERVRDRRGLEGSKKSPQERLEYIEERIGKIKDRMERLQEKLDRGREGKGL
ncbi:MAG: hypothetical protein ACYTG7_02040 [Planctomycetota bacterium]